MAKLPRGVTINLALDALPVHLSTYIPEDLVPGHTNKHVVPRHVLQPIDLSHPLQHALGDILHRLSRAQDVPQMLRICIQAQRGHTKISMDDIPIPDHMVGVTGRHPGRLPVPRQLLGTHAAVVRSQDGHARLEPGGVIKRLDAVPHPPLQIRRRRPARRDEPLAKGLLDDRPGRLHHPPVPLQPAVHHGGDDLHGHHGLEDERAGPLLAHGSPDGVALAGVEAAAEGELGVRVQGDAARLLVGQHGAELGPDERGVVDPAVRRRRPAGGVGEE